MVNKIFKIAAVDLKILTWNKKIYAFLLSLFSILSPYKEGKSAFEIWLGLTLIDAGYLGC